MYTNDAQIEFGSSDSECTKEFNYNHLLRKVTFRTECEKRENERKCLCRSAHFEGIHENNEECLATLLDTVRKRYNAGYAWCETYFYRRQGEKERNNQHLFLCKGLYKVSPQDKDENAVYRCGEVKHMITWQFNEEVIKEAIEQLKLLGLERTYHVGRAQKIEFGLAYTADGNVNQGKCFDGWCKCGLYVIGWILSMAFFILFVMESGKNAQVLADCSSTEPYSFCRGSTLHRYDPFPCRLTGLSHLIHLANLTQNAK